MSAKVEQERLAQSAERAATLARERGNEANARFFERLAAMHREVAAQARRAS